MEQTEKMTATEQASCEAAESPQTGPATPGRESARAAAEAQAAETDGPAPEETEKTGPTGGEAETEVPALDEAQKALFERIERENARLLAERGERDRRDRAAETARGWQREAEALISVYPSLDLQAELKAPTGPRFTKLLLGGADVRTAYEAVHRDEILAAAMRFAAERAREMTVSDIRARGTRPAENGVDGTAPASLGRVNVHELTRREREAIARRVLRGERVEL